ncbi:transposable element Tcb2 transposase [Trichonephila clavipes]|nr:transposable element Tcb2 transposase [Trichonephila clavipes]
MRTHDCCPTFVPTNTLLICYRLLESLQRPFWKPMVAVVIDWTWSRTRSRCCRVMNLSPGTTEISPYRGEHFGPVVYYVLTEPKVATFILLKSIETLSPHVGVLWTFKRRPRQTSRREDRHIVRNARVQPTASSTAIQAQVRPSLEAPVSFRTIRKRPTEGHLGSRHPLRVLPLAPTHRRLRLEWCRARGNWTAAERNQVVFSDESRLSLSSDDNRIRVWRPHGERLNPALPYSDTPLPQLA